MASTNGYTASQTDADLDVLYSWIAPQPAPQPCPEALFSLTLKGTIGGHEALVTARGMSAEEFKANLQAIKGLLDPVSQPSTPQAASQGQDWCKVHNVAMKENLKDGRRWYSHQVDGHWCKGRQ
jgi:hypothetical protein